MTGKQRVFDILEGRKPDRMPFYLSYDDQVAKTICKAHKIKPDEIRDFYGCDIECVPVYIAWARDMPVAHSLSNAKSAGDIDSFPWPDESVLDTAACFDKAKKARDTGRAVCGGVWASIFTGARHLLGEEHFLTAIYENPELIRAVVDRMTDCCLKINKAYFDACGDVCDIYHFGSDFGTQGSMFISPGMFDEFFAPNIKRLADQAKGYGKRVMFHTCGSVTPIVGSLVNCGIDIIEPVQVSAADMSAEYVAAKFKGRVAFLGGISSQVTFTTGTPDIIYEETQTAIRTLGPFGYIPAPDHELIGSVTAENVDAFVKAVKEYQI